MIFATHENLWRTTKFSSKLIRKNWTVWKKWLKTCYQKNIAIKGFQIFQKWHQLALATSFFLVLCVSLPIRRTPKQRKDWPRFLAAIHTVNYCKSSPLSSQHRNQCWVSCCLNHWLSNLRQLLDSFDETFQIALSIKPH